MLFFILGGLLSTAMTFPLSIELQQDQPHCFVQQFEPNSKINVHYSIFKENNIPN